MRDEYDSVMIHCDGILVDTYSTTAVIDSWVDSCSVGRGAKGQGGKERKVERPVKPD